MIGDNVRAAMKAADIRTEAELSRRSGVPQPTIHRILTGESKDPRRSNLEKIATACMVSVEALVNFDPEKDRKIKRAFSIFTMLDRDIADKHRRPDEAEKSDQEVAARWREEEIQREMRENSITLDEYDLEYLAEQAATAQRESRRAKSPADDELEFIGHMDAWDSKTPLDPDEVELPLFREVELAAGAGATQVIENHGAKLRFAKSTLKRANVLPEHAACAFIKGNSMEPVMPGGTTVGVNTADTEIRDGEIYAIDHDGMLRVKYLHRKPGGGLKIVSQNSVDHPTEEYTAQEVIDKSIRVIGRVFWWSVLR